MVKKILGTGSVLLLCIGALLCADQPGTVVYTEGYVDLRDSAGEMWELYIGDGVSKGDTIITHPSALAEIEKEDYSIIKIAPNTVFTFMEKEEGGEKRSVYSTAFGSVTFKFNKVLGREPNIATPSIVAGVRGTEFTVYCGADGSSFVAVSDGKVAVSSEGETVELDPDEGVEVVPGEPPGEKVQVKGRELDFTAWNKAKFERIIETPIQSALRAEKRLHWFAEEMAAVIAQHTALNKQIEKEKTNAMKIKEEDGEKEAVAYYDTVIYPMEVTSGFLYLNKRYYALSALSFRRFVLGRMYIILKSRYINNPDATEYSEFLSTYNRIMEYFEKVIIPHIVEADI